MAIEDIKNFLSVGKLLGTGGQPTEAQLGEVAAAGFEVVVNLGLLDPKYCLSDEAGLAAKVGMEYHHIPVKFDDPTVADVERFIEVMNACSTQNVFIHCALNWRVSAFVAIYGQLRLGWSAEQADSHMRTFWAPNETWTRLVAECREKLSLCR